MKRLYFLPLAASLMLLALPAAAQTLSQLEWLRGTWSQTKGDAVVQESWLGPRGGMMAGVNLSSSAQGSSFEFLRVVEKDGVISYLASPDGSTPTEFKLKELLGQRVVFENLANDFPQRIIYWKAADGSLKARIEGDINGKARSMEWQFASSKQ